MATERITDLPVANTIDGVNDTFPIVTNSINTTQQISRNTFLGLGSAPVGLTDTQTLTNKTLTTPTISSPVLSGTITGTYTLGGTPTFPASVVTLTGTQTLTNKTLTSPIITSPAITNATISADNITGFTSSSSGTIYGIAVSSGAITGSNTVNGSSLVAGTVGTAAIATNAITTAKLATGSNFEPVTVMMNPYKCSVSLTASQTTTAGSFTKILFDTTTSPFFDTSSNYSMSNHRFVPTVTGYYYVNTRVGILPVSSMTRGVISIFKGGVDALRGNDLAMGASVNYGLTASALMFLNTTTDYIEVFVDTIGANGPVDNSVNSTHLDVYLVSAT